MKYILLTIPHAACDDLSLSTHTRICDGRAYVAGMHIYEELERIIDKTRFEVVVFPNLTVLRSLCDLNRYDYCPVYNIKDDVHDFVNQKGSADIVMNLDVHSYPRTEEEGYPVNFFTLMLPESQPNRMVDFLRTFFDANRSRIGNRPLVGYYGSWKNYFMSYFTGLGKYSLLVEFNERVNEYSDAELARDTKVWAEYVKKLVDYIVK